MQFLITRLVINSGIISGMSETVRVQLFYGPGEVRYGEEGVDLSLFSTVTRDVKKAAQRSWEAITTWLYRAFSLNSEQYRLSVMAVFNRSHLSFWELMPLEGTRDWRIMSQMHVKAVVWWFCLSKFIRRLK